MKIGEKIQKLRKNRKFSQNELAVLLGVHVTHISRLETGKYSPSLELIKKLAETFEITSDYLVFDDIDSISTINFENKTLLERMKLLETLAEEDQRIIIGVIDAFLKKQQMRNVLDKSS